MSNNKVCYEVMLDKIKSMTEEVLKETPEARSVIVVVDWLVGQQDFPPCSIIAKEISERSLIDCIKQLTKTLEHLSFLFRQKVSSADSILNKAEKLISESKSISSS